MSNLADGNTAALRAYEAEQVRNERISDRCAIQAERDIQEAAELADAIDFYDQHHAAAECLARCFRELDGACRGEMISLDAITTALHNLKRDLIARRNETLVSEWEG